MMHGKPRRTPWGVLPTRARHFYSVKNTVQKMILVDSSELGIAFGPAGATTVFRCVATTRSPGDLPEGCLCSMTSKTLAFTGGGPAAGNASHG